MVARIIGHGEEELIAISLKGQVIRGVFGGDSIP